MNNHLLCAAASTALLSCAPVERASDAATPKPIPTYPHSGIFVSQFTGRLLYEKDCLLFRTSRGQHFVLIWPEGSSFDGRRITVAIPGRAPKTLTVGRTATIAGSAQDWENVPPSPALGDTPRRCAASPYFVVEV